MSLNVTVTITSTDMWAVSFQFRYRFRLNTANFAIPAKKFVAAAKINSTTYSISINELAATAIFFSAFGLPSSSFIVSQAVRDIEHLSL